MGCKNYVATKNNSFAYRFSLVGRLFYAHVWTGTVAFAPAVRLQREQIYFTGTSRSDTPITFEMNGGMMGGHMTYVDCHGSEGRGGRVRMMMASYTAPDIRYTTRAAVCPLDSSP